MSVSCGISRRIASFSSDLVSLRSASIRPDPPLFALSLPTHSLCVPLFPRHTLFARRTCLELVIRLGQLVSLFFAAFYFNFFATLDEITLASENSPLPEATELRASWLIHASHRLPHSIRVHIILISIPYTIFSHLISKAVKMKFL